MLTEITTRTEENKALVRRFIIDIFGAGNVDAVDDLVADDFIPHDWGKDAKPGKDTVRETITRAHAGISNPLFSIELMVAEDDLVAVRLIASGEHTGEFMGIPATGRTYTITEMHMFRIAGGKVAEHWHNADFLGMMRQLGAA